MPTGHTDPELISACRNRQAWAWDALVDRYKALVYSIALRSGLDKEDAADVFQTVFARLLENVEAIRAPQGLAAWLITTTKRECWRSLRQRAHEPAASGVLLGQTATQEELQHAQADEDRLADRALIVDALELVGERCKQLLHLLYFDPREPPYEEICDRLRMPLGSVGPTRARCLQKMREILRRMGMGAT